MVKIIHRLRLFLIICSLVFLASEALSANLADNTVFVILRHVRHEGDNRLWKRCLHSVREFYPDVPVVIIDDNSSWQVPEEIMDNVIVIHSEYPGAGELLPYYYFLKYKWSDKMIFLHDSMLLKREFNVDEWDHPVIFHWHFDQHQSDEDGIIDDKLRNLPFAEKLIALNHAKSFWNGCFGVASIIDLRVLEKLEAKYFFTRNLINKIKTRSDRMALERIFAILLFKEGCVTKETCANFGSILNYPNCFLPTSEKSLKQLKLTYPGAILKTWHGR